MVHRIWQENGLAPHRFRQFKLSNDPAFAAKVEDVVGLYVDPPDHAVVLSIDEKSQIQPRQQAVWIGVEKGPRLGVGPLGRTEIRRRLHLRRSRCQETSAGHWIEPNRACR
jgi:hypothetical protein